jgi:CO/xanthine dehydrogenase FAD-binding subunit
MFSTAADAARALSGDRATRFMGGGTLVMRAVNEGDQSFSTIVLTKDPALKQIQAHGDRMVIGAGVTMGQILASRELDFLHPVARAVGGPAVRSMATIGGNLFAEHPYGDMAAALLVLDAKVTTAEGRSIALAEFLKDRAREPRTLIASIDVIRPQAGVFRFKKVSRVKPKGVSLMTIAAWLPQSGGRISGARIAYSSMGPTPFRVTAVEQALEGASLDQTGIANALAAATNGIEPPTDAISSSWYRKEVAPVHLKRLLLGG